MSANHQGLGSDKDCIKAIYLLIWLYQNKSIRVLQNVLEMSIIFFERLQDCRKPSLSSSPHIL